MTEKFTVFFGVIISVLALFTAVSTTPNVCSAAEPQTILSWDFNDVQSVEEWTPASLTKPVLHDGALKAREISWDPFVVSPHFMLKPRQGQYVEIRMRSTGAGIGEIFFASSDEGKYNGFSQEKTASWRIRHDGEFHTYQIMPAWLAEPQIIKIRVDVGRPETADVERGAELEIDYIRILDIGIDEAAPMGRSDWDENALSRLQSDAVEGRNEWISEIGRLDPAEIGSNLYFEWQNVDNGADDEPFPRATLRCLTASGSGQTSVEIPLFNLCQAADSSDVVFSKNVELGAYKEWGAPFFRWEVSLPSAVKLRRVAFTKEPIGDGVLETQDGRQSELARLYNGLAAVQYETIVRNCGGAPLGGFKLTADSNDDVLLKEVVIQKIAVDPLLGFNPIGDRSSVQTVDASGLDATIVAVKAQDSVAAFPDGFSLLPGEACKIVSKYDVKSSGDFDVALRLSATTSKKETANALTVALKVLPSAELPKNVSYVPEPRNLESDYEIGAFYFPGWSRSVNWEKIDSAAPIRKPLLGYYDESNPEVVDWQIKWAAENGIRFFLVDWYWRHGQISLDHWINAFQHAKYRSHLKWAIMWANHTGYGTHSTEDWTKVSQFWIDNYFKTPEYYTIDGKPVVALWQQEILDHDMREEALKEGVELKQGEGCKRAFDITRKMCEEAGLPGVYFIAMKWPEESTDPRVVQELANGSFDETTIYHFMYPGKGVANPMLYSFDQVVAASKTNWEERHETGILPFMPNISTGWDSRPWHGFRSVVVYGRSVKSFKRLLEDYKSFADKTGIKRAVLGPLNEWGEGSYIEPNNEFGFGMYEAIRDVLCKRPEGGFPVNYAPHEIGLGPYDYPKNSKK